MAIGFKKNAAHAAKKNAKEPGKKKKFFLNPQDDTVQTAPGSMHARIIDYKSGLQVIGGVRAVRILSEKYRLLIMEDYMPTLGKVVGDVVILTNDNEITFDHISGFYKLQHNEFTLLIEEDRDENAAPAAENAAPAAESAEPAEKAAASAEPAAPAEEPAKEPAPEAEVGTVSIEFDEPSTESEEQPQ